jgi:hypothetical protein
MTARMFHCVLMCASCALACLVCRGPVIAEMGESVSGDKKLIGWAPDVVQPAYLKQYIGELEAQFPLDGIVMTVDSDDFVRDRTGLGAIEFVYEGRTHLGPVQTPDLHGQRQVAVPQRSMYRAEERHRQDQIPVEY